MRLQTLKIQQDSLRSLYIYLEKVAI